MASLALNALNDGHLILTIFRESHNERTDMWDEHSRALEAFRIARLITDPAYISTRFE